MHDAYLINLLIFHSNSVGSLHPSGGDKVGESSLYYQTESSDSQPSSKGEMEGITERYSKIMKGSWVDQFRYGSNPWMTRYLYALLFLIANLLAWAVRDYGHSILKEIKRLKGCNGGEDRMGAEGVLRVSLGCS
ncbi:hypothetical protein P3S68_028413 [Capsicum galapagoense]